MGPGIPGSDKKCDGGGGHGPSNLPCRFLQISQLEAHYLELEQTLQEMQVKLWQNL